MAVEKAITVIVASIVAAGFEGGAHGALVGAIIVGTIDCSIAVRVDSVEARIPLFWETTTFFDASVRVFVAADDHTTRRGHHAAWWSRYAPDTWLTVFDAIAELIIVAGPIVWSEDTSARFAADVSGAINAIIADDGGSWGAETARTKLSAVTKVSIVTVVIDFTTDAHTTVRHEAEFTGLAEGCIRRV